MSGLAHVHTALDRPYVGPSDGIIVDTRTSNTVEFWGMGGRPTLVVGGTSDYLKLVFPDGAWVQFSDHSLLADFGESGGQLRIDTTLPRSLSRYIRRRRQAGAHPLPGTPLLLGVRRLPVPWPPQLAETSERIGRRYPLAWDAPGHFNFWYRRDRY